MGARGGLVPFSQRTSPAGGVSVGRVMAASTMPAYIASLFCPPPASQSPTWPVISPTGTYQACSSAAATAAAQRSSAFCACRCSLSVAAPGPCPPTQQPESATMSSSGTRMPQRRNCPAITPTSNRQMRCGNNGPRDQRPVTSDQRPETRDQRPETRDQRPETRDQRPETRDQIP